MGKDLFQNLRPHWTKALTKVIPQDALAAYSWSDEPEEMAKQSRVFVVAPKSLHLYQLSGPRKDDFGTVFDLKACSLPAFSLKRVDLESMLFREDQTAIADVRLYGETKLWVTLTQPLGDLGMEIEFPRAHDGLNPDETREAVAKLANALQEVLPASF